MRRCLAGLRAECLGLQHHNQFVTVAAGDYAVSGLATHWLDAGAFKYGIALFSGYSGITRLREKGGLLRCELVGNFLVQARLYQGLARHLILTAFLFRVSRNAPGLFGVSWEILPKHLLWGHHETIPAHTRPFIQRRGACSGVPTVCGGDHGCGNACQA